VLEAAGFETWLVNARDVKHLPGRPKTDKLDAVWLCKVAERQMIRPSFVPPPPIRRLRDVTRYRIDLVGARTAEKQRAEKLLSLGEGVDSENLIAGYADGVLHLTIPASPKAQARRVKVTRAAGGSRVVPGSTVEPGEAPADSTGGGAD
jgi:transposase